MQKDHRFNWPWGQEAFTCPGKGLQGSRELLTQNKLYRRDPRKALWHQHH